MYKNLIDKYKIGIIGLGFVGSAIRDFLVSHMIDVVVYDKYKNGGIGMSVEALPANAAVLTCLANDEGYESIFSQQLKVKANPDDVLIGLSGVATPKMLSVPWK